MPFDQIKATFDGSPLAESHVIETPEQTNIEFTVAGIGSRFLALMIDTLIQIGVSIAAIIPLAVILPRMAKRAPIASAWIVAGLILCVFLIFYGYFLFFEIYWSGQTPGKRRIGLRVIKDTGRRLSPMESIARNLLRIIDQMPGFYAVGILVAMLNRQNKRLGDFVAGSIVVREASLAQIKQTWRDSTPAAVLVQTPLGAQRLSDDDVILIESFLQRRHQLALNVRTRIATEIFHKVKPKLDSGAEGRREIESLLESAVRERRGIL